MSTPSSTTNELDTVICLEPDSPKRGAKPAQTGDASPDSADRQHVSNDNNNNNDTNHCGRHEQLSYSSGKKWPASGRAKAEAELERDQQEAVDHRWSCCPSASSANIETGLLYYNREPLKLKDFNAEVRAPMDVEQFAHQAELMLDLNEVSMEGIIEAMLTKVSSRPAPLSAH